MSLMASGFNGQGFSFHGYLPVDDAAKARRIRELESAALHSSMTQIFIETPYRNNRTIKLLASTLRGSTLLCVAAGITDPQLESIITLPASEWTRKEFDYNKIPAIFLIGAAPEL